LITWQWRQASDAPDVRDLITRAAAADQEMGFSTIASGRAGASAPRVRSFDLLARGVRRGTEPGAGPEAPAACLRLDLADDGTGEACLLTDPGYRSLGIATALLEGLGRPSAPGSGWPSPELRTVAFWAAGSHPAAERLARRFGLTPTAEVVRLRRRLTGGGEAGRTAGDYRVADLAGLDPDRVRKISREVAVTQLSGWRLPTAGRPAPAESDRQCARVALAPDGRVCGLVYLRAVGPAAGETTTADRTGLITAIGAGPDADRRAVLEALITDALRALASMGQDHAEAALPAQEAELAGLLRSMRFRHDQTDVCYELSRA
jgi:mycothiol synthase